MKSPLERSAGRLLASCLLASCLSLLQLAAGQEPGEPAANFPYYMQSPQQSQPQQQKQSEPSVIMQRNNIPPVHQQQPQSVIYERPAPQLPTGQKPLAQPSTPPLGQQTSGCLYGQHYFAHFDQCLERKPYPTIGLPAFKNDDLLSKRTGNSLADRHGCSFILTNGLFKNYQLNKYALSDALDGPPATKCLDEQKVAHLSMKFANVTLYYLWQLRCLNQANQLLDDATLNGKTSSIEHEAGSSSGAAAGHQTICVGSSQNFGFASLQVSNIEAQVELAVDIYKNWRVTNITLAMLPGSSSGPSKSALDDPSSEHEQLKSSAIRDFTFESLDGDELNWRYLNLYDNWTRNRLHANFLDQFRRFLWISLQRCVSESADKLPVKLVDLFGQQRYNS